MTLIKKISSFHQKRFCQGVFIETPWVLFCVTVPFYVVPGTVPLVLPRGVWHPGPWTHLAAIPDLPLLTPLNIIQRNSHKRTITRTKI